MSGLKRSYHRFYWCLHCWFHRHQGGYWLYSYRRARAISAFTGVAGVIAVAAAAAFILFLANPGECEADSLWRDGTASLYRDHKAGAVGDVLTVLIVEKAVATNEAQTSSGNDAHISLAEGAGLFSFIPGAGFSTGTGFTGGKSTTRSGNLVAKMTARVTEVMPNGCLKIQGTQGLTINNEKQNIVITGIVRPQDIHPDNTVLSTYIADAEIKYEGSTEVAKRSGLLGYLQRFFSGLINLIF